MACANCVRAIEQASLVLFELSSLHADEMPTGTDWRHVANQLRDLSIALTNQRSPFGEEDGRKA